MSDAIYTAASIAAAQEMRLNVLANNMANINTVGFKEDRAIFKAELADASQDDQLDPIASANTMVAFDGTQTNFGNGNLRSTGNPLDVAINGDGFFVVETEDGMRYTRNGRFQLNGEGMLTTGEGHLVQGDRGGIRIEDGTVSIDASGNISVDGQVLDRLQVVAIDQPKMLQKAGDTLFAPPPGGSQQVTVPSPNIQQGALEMSNVNAIHTMTAMIETQRAFEAQQRIIQSIDSTTTSSISKIGSVA